jgi:DNA-binding GntR family transcriptional regulator
VNHNELSAGQTSADDMRPKAGTRSEHVRELIEEGIATGSFPPGMRLDEMELAERFNVSRTPLREALFQLASAGIVVMQPRRGTIVAEVTPHRLVEMFEVMGELEAACVRLATQRMSPAERVRLEVVHRRSFEAVRNNDKESYRALNFEFHDVIYRGAHNEFLLATTIGIRQRIAPFRRAQFAIAERLAKSHAEHDAILRAVLSGDGQTASELMRNHVNIVRAASWDYVHGLERSALGLDVAAVSA